MPVLEKSSPKYLVVDDLIAPNKTYQERFRAQIGVPRENVVFASNYEEATQQIKSISNIVLCFVDCIIPKTYKKEGLLEKIEEYERQKDSLSINNLKLAEWGIKIISENQQLEICAFSAHLDAKDLSRLANQYSNVVKTAEKPLRAKDLESLRPKYIEPFFPQPITANKVSGNLAPRPKKSFDYSSLDENLSFFIQEKTQEIKRLVRRTSEDIIEIGTYLIEVKSKLGHGNFYNWLDAEFSWSYTSASRFMSVANRFESSTVQDLEILPSALYELASASVPEAAVTEALDRAKQGETIDKKTAKGIKAKYKSPQKQISKTTQSLTVEKVPVDEADLRGANQLVKEPESRKRKNSNSSQTSLTLQPQQEILKVYPGSKAVRNSWWQLGEHHQLFCGSPNSDKFLARLPSKIALGINFPPKNNKSLIPSIKAKSELSFGSEYDDISVDWLVKTLSECIRETTEANETVVFSYLFDLKLLEKAVELYCCCIVAEPDLSKCDLILQKWREKEPNSVIRIKY